MIFIITPIAFVMERFFHWHHLRHWRWFIHYEGWLSNHTSRLPSWLRLLINVLPPILVIGTIGCLLSGWFYGIFELIFGVIILLYCLGPENLWVQVYRCIDKINKEDPEVAISEVQASFGIATPDNSQAFHQAFVRAIFLAAHQRIFSVIFWFVVLGPLGAVLYRLIELFSLRAELGLVEIATQIKRLLDWIPVRILTFLFALGGHFTEVFQCWKQGVSKGLDSSEQLLTDCGIAALDAMEGDQLPETGAAEKESLELLDRVFVIALVVLAIIVIIT